MKSMLCYSVNFRLDQFPYPSILDFKNSLIERRNSGENGPSIINLIPYRTIKYLWLILICLSTLAQLSVSFKLLKRNLNSASLLATSRNYHNIQLTDIIQYFLFESDV